MDESLSGMFKMTGPNNLVGKSKMRDMLVCKDLWLPVQYGKDQLDKLDSLAWKAMHLKTTTYIWCFIDMSLYKTFNYETEVDVL